MDWTDWYERHAPALLLYARQWARSAVDAEDAVQDGFVRWWKSRRRGAPDRPPDHDLPLLFLAVKHAALDATRKARRRIRREADAAQMLYDGADMFSPDGAESWRRAVETGLRRLPPEQREVLVLKIWGGLTFRQIAEVTEVSHNTAASRYRLALDRLRRHVQIGDSAEVEAPDQKQAVSHE